MDVQGVSTRKVRAVTEELCGHGFSASTVSAITVQLDAELERFMTRPLNEEYAYLILDARYEHVRGAGVIRSRAVLVAIGIDFRNTPAVIAVYKPGGYLRRLLAGCVAEPGCGRTFDVHREMAGWQ